jgi:hypothetical protein
VDKTNPGFLRGGFIFGIHAEQNDLQMWNSLLEQPAAIDGGGAVEAQIQQKLVSRIRCLSTDQGFYNPILDNARCVHFFVEAKG